MDLKDVLAANLRRIRQGRGMTQEELADRAQISARYIGSIERAAVAPTITILGNLSEALGVDPCELIGRKARR